MTLLMSMPADLEPLMEKAVKNGLEDEDAIEDAVVKILQYRILFGLGVKELDFEPTIINGFKQIVDPIFEALAKVSEEKPA